MERIFTRWDQTVAKGTASTGTEKPWSCGWLKGKDTWNRHGEENRQESGATLGTEKADGHGGQPMEYRGKGDTAGGQRGLLASLCGPQGTKPHAWGNTAPGALDMEGWLAGHLTHSAERGGELEMRPFEAFPVSPGGKAAPNTRPPGSRADRGCLSPPGLL